MEKLTGDFSGLLIFRKRSIKVVDDEIDLDEIQKMEFNASDFDGKKWMNFRSPDPKLSNGINNRASLVTKKGVRLDFNFQQAYEDEFHLKMRNLLISYHLADKIS
ncbi:hypothetical protein J0A68_06195 [Algoriphagus sp. H41]|uniref:Uncharacterized protein n=1 Tax=Algoriphagus oliviformis TaxID=2811231 RepID=A0ABS3C0A6_9BACT|nr:hypothetical protein [Algoriphagus oliviformis]MBN7810537.1 hypothetical protein [Algoriphagus oliviformis]